MSDLLSILAAVVLAGRTSASHETSGMVFATLHWVSMKGAGGWEHEGRCSCSPGRALVKVT
jgi:hypothetical protein